jgi:hypothetical protein
MSDRTAALRGNCEKNAREEALVRAGQAALSVFGFLKYPPTSHLCRENGPREILALQDLVLAIPCGSRAQPSQGRP